ncbi:MAG: metallophosphoesterase [Acidobacteriota bacterium]
MSQVKPQILVFSDTHLGEETSLLAFPHGCQHLWKVLREKFGEKASIEEVVLVGDIPDRCLSSTSQIISNTNYFMNMLNSALKMKRVVYVPGNHDHTIWTDYRRRRYGEANKYGISAPSGDLIISKGKRSHEGSDEELLSIFFGYPGGEYWRQIEGNGDFDFVFTNPIYVKQINNRIFVFTHGTHFRPDVTLPRRVKWFCDKIGVDWLAGLDIEPGGSIKDVRNLEELEKAVSPFVDSLWASSKNDPKTRSDQIWYLLSWLSDQFNRKKRPSPKHSEIFTRSELQKLPSERFHTLTGSNTDNSLERWQEYFHKHMMRSIKDNGFEGKEVVFIYGDTHMGGWGDLHGIRIYNTGSWVVHNAEDHPACHIFVIDEQGDEYLLDVSFKDVCVAGDSILKLAAEDAEHRKSAVDKVLKTVTDVVTSISAH